MIKRLITALLGILIMLSIITSAAAAEQARALRSDTVISVNGARIPLRAYSIDGRLYIDLFEFAVALSGTENQFALRWRDRNTSLHLTSGTPYTSVGLDTSKRIAGTAMASPVEINVLLDGDKVDISAFRVTSEIYFDLRDLAGILDFSMEWDQTEDIIDINTSRTFADSRTMRKIDPSKPMVALTFDDGPSIYTPPILDVLEQYGGAVTFYVTGNRVERNRDIVIRAYEMGCEIANHTWSHKMLTKLSEESIRRELLNTIKTVESVTGSPALSMRPPYGMVNQRVKNIAAELDLPIVFWSVDPSDWRTKNADTTYDHVMENIKDKDIVLMHDLSEPSAEAAKRLIPALIRNGFQLVTVSELFYYSGIKPEPGVVYRSGEKEG